MVANKLTAGRLRSVLTYFPIAGCFYWRLRTSNRIKVGDLAGAPHNAGYIQIMVDGENHLAHRLAWLHFYGEWPAQEVDHMNGDRLDNGITNLRDVPNAINMQNLRGPTSKNTSGFLGVSWSAKDRTWVAHISLRNRSHYVGSYDDPATAYAAYIARKRLMHEGCTL